MLTLATNPTERAYPSRPTMAPTDCVRGVRRWVGTWNNYRDTAIDELRSMKLSISWAIVAKEVAPSTGTPHLQIYLLFKNCVKFNTLRQLFPDVWWAPAKGDNKENYLYITKTRPARTMADGTEVPADVPNPQDSIFEWGQRPNFDALLEGIFTCLAYFDSSLDTFTFCSMHPCQCDNCEETRAEFDSHLCAAYTLMDMYKDSRPLDI